MLLDYSIPDAKSRVQFLKTQSLVALTPNQIETAANFLLYGKDPDGTSVVDRGLVEIKAKHTHTSSKVSSIEALMESPTFDQSQFQPLSKSIPKTPKPNLQRTETLAQIPGMKDLWTSIDGI